MRAARRRMFAGFVVLTALILYAVAPVRAAATDREAPPTHARDAIDAFTAQSPAEDNWWPDAFPAIAGYTPKRIDDYWVNPDGDCSSPVPLPPEFTDACREHDLGYDLLRYGAETNEPLPPTARLRIDDVFAERLADSCSTATTPAPACATAAAVAATAVRANSLRQGLGVPIHEPWLPIQLIGLGAALALALVSARPRKQELRRLLGDTPTRP